MSGVMDRTIEVGQLHAENVVWAKAKEVKC